MSDMQAYEKAVSYRGGNIAVSASAGCGKTTTMIKRIEDIIVKERISVSRLLVVTFTRAAAAEMKEKLKKTLLAYPEGSFEYQEGQNLDISDISTIHSFCSRVCAEFFDIAGNPPI
jgi:ATP-dependent helicase/nuclease subunit A